MAADPDIQLFCKISGTKCSGVSACKARVKADSQACLSSDTKADTTRLPLILIVRFSGTVRPIQSALTFHFTAILLMSSAFFGSQVITTRPAFSPKSADSQNDPSALRLTSTPTPAKKPDSARATANPPSEQSCADSINPC